MTHQNKSKQALIDELNAAYQKIAKLEATAQADKSDADTVTAILSVLPDLMFRLSANGTYLQFFAPSQNQLLIQPQDFLGKSVAEVLPSAVAARCITAIERSLAGHKQIFEYYLDFPDAERAHYEAHMVAVDAETVIVLVHDITKRKQAEEKLITSEARWRSLVQNAPNILFEFNRDGIIQFINFTAIDGGVEDVIGTSLFDYTLPENHEHVRAYIEQVYQTGEPITYETLGLAGRWYSVRIGAIKHGQAVVSFMMILTDITELKQSEIALRQSEERLRQAMRIARLGIWDWEIATDVTQWYGEMFNIYGITPESFTGLGADYIEFTRDDYRQQQLNNIQNAFERGVTEAQLRDGTPLELHPKELCIVRPDGTEAYTLGDAIVIVDDAGKPMRMLGVTYEITERKIAEEQLKQAKDAAEAAANAATLAEQETQARLRDTQGLFRAAQAILISSDVADICHVLINHFNQLVDADRTAVFLVDHEQRAILLNQGVGSIEGVVPMTYDELEAGISGIVFKSGQPILSASLDDEPAETRQRRLNDGIGSLIVVPLIVKSASGAGRNIGTISALKRQGQEAFTQYEVDLLMTLVGQAATAIEGIRLYEDAQREIAERKQAEARLMASLEYNERILNASLNGIYIYEFEVGLNSYINQQYTRLLGYTLESINAMTAQEFFSLFHPDDHQRIADHMQEVANAQDNAVYEIEYRFKNIQGQWRWCFSRDTLFSFDDDGKGRQMIGTFLDITERKQAEQILQARVRLVEYAINHSFEELMQSLLNEAELLTNSANSFLHVVDTAQQTITFQAFSGKTIEMCDIDRQTHEMSIGKAGVWKDCILHKRPIIHNDFANLEHLHGSPEGHISIERQLLVPIIRNNRVVAIVGVGNKPDDYEEYDIDIVGQLTNLCWDIVAHKQTELELSRSAEVLALKDRIISSVSHEFRTPLAIIQTSYDLLTTYGDRLTDERREKTFQQIHQQIVVLTELINDMLSISRAQMGKIEFNPSLIDLEAFCQTMFDQIRFMDNEDHHFKFISELSGMRFMVDGKLLQHILMNLLTNAVKYSPHNSNITLELNYNQQTVVVKVSDEGIGIPLLDQPQLFEPFHRASNVGNTAGTGVGLSIVREYVRLHGGSITVESEPQQGSTFIVTLPVR